MLRFLPMLAAALAAGCAVAPELTRIERDELAPTGVLRGAVYTGEPALGVSDALRGEPRGTTASLGKQQGDVARAIADAGLKDAGIAPGGGARATSASRSERAGARRARRAAIRRTPDWSSRASGTRCG